MRNKNDDIYKRLREKAESILSGHAGQVSDKLRDKAARIIAAELEDLDNLGPDEIRRLVYDLRIHQVELEVQNEELRNTQRQLESSRDNFYRLYNLAPLGYLTVDSAALILQANQTLADMLGQAVADICRRSLVEFIAEEDKPIFLGRFKAFFKQPTDKAIELRMRCENGSTFYARLEGRLVEQTDILMNKQYGGEQLLFTVSDITDRKKAEFERERVLEKLAEKTKDMERLLRIVSHDLRAPLVNIQGFGSELVRDCGQLTDMLGGILPQLDSSGKIKKLAEEYIPESVNFIVTSAAKMDSLVRGLGELSRLGCIELRLQLLDMNLMIDKIFETAQFQIKQTGIKVERERLPQCMGDPIQINQVFSNLISNAIKYLDAQRAGVIRVTGSVQGGMARYCVEDNGIGITSEHKDRIFEVFYRVNPENEISGEGLGLAAVKQIIDRHRGSISVESQAGEGSRFYIQLPMV